MGAEAEPEAYYGGIGYGYGAYVPPTGLPVQPLVTAWNGAVVPRKTPAVEAAEADHYAAKFGKREADSEADAYYGYGGYGGYGLGYGGYGYGGLGYGYGKRSADAKPYYGYGGAYTGYGYGGYGLGLGYAYGK